MTTPPAHPRIVECQTAEEALQSICNWFFKERISMEGSEPVTADAMPASYRTLLDHREHMTSTLGAYHGEPVKLQVINQRTDGDIYTRSILLQLERSNHVVEFGIMRTDLRDVSEAVRREVLEEGTPLGDILMAHQVLRQIEPRWFFHFAAGAPMTRYFGGGDAFGRVGVIYTAGQPTIELLEVVTDVRHSS